MYRYLPYKRNDENPAASGREFQTDGELTVGVLSVEDLVQVMPPSELPNSAPVKFKNRLWTLVRHLFKQLNI